MHHPDPYALVKLTGALGRQDELTGPAGAPSTRLVTELCQRLIARHDLAAVRLPPPPGG